MYFVGVGPGGKQVLENWVVIWGIFPHRATTKNVENNQGWSRFFISKSKPHLSLSFHHYAQLWIINQSPGSLHNSPQGLRTAAADWHHWEAQRLWLHPPAILLSIGVWPSRTCMYDRSQTFYFRNILFHLKIWQPRLQCCVPSSIVCRILNNSPQRRPWCWELKFLPLSTMENFNLGLGGHGKKGRIASGCITPAWVLQWLQLSAYDDEQPSKCWHLCTLLGTLLQARDTLITGIKFALAVYRLVTGKLEVTPTIVCW